MKGPPSLRLWPFGPRMMVLAVPGILLGLLVVVGIIHGIAAWPDQEAAKFVFPGILLFSLLPVMLAVVDLIVERGGVLEYRGAKLDFSRARAPGPGSFAVPTNIGVPGRALTDSDTKEILDALRQAAATEVVVVDLEGGQAWWETRLLVLIAGAVRQGQLAAIVFVGTEAGNRGMFQGWAPPRALLPALLQSDSRYAQSYYAAQAAAQQWALVGPIAPGTAPPVQTWMLGLAPTYPWMAYDSATGLPNEFTAEQCLAADLGAKVETPTKPQGMSVVRLQALFKPVLALDVIDESADGDDQLRALFSGSSRYVAVTQRGRYQRLIKRSVLTDFVLESLVLPQRAK
jgi:hypothetical protein